MNMTNVKITRWQPLNHDGAGIASFNFKVRGVTVRAAMFTHDGDGYRICMPFTQHRQRNGLGLTAVGLEHDDVQAVTAAALAYYKKLDGEPDDAGMRRAIGEDVAEALAIAGLGD